MKCNKCGAEISEKEKYCPRCGNPIIRIKPKSLCSGCGTEIPDNVEYCPGCGKKIIRRSPEEKSLGNENRISTDNAGSGNIPNVSFSSGSIRKDVYAWEQAVLPSLIALIYFLVKQGGEGSQALLNSLLIFAGFTVMFGFMDVAELNRILRGQKMVLSEELQMQIAFLPIVGLWKRRLIPGLDKAAAYPHAHCILVLIYAFVISFGGNLNQLLYL